jgi:rhodanese-related sulfurtransferase/peroxiredoxin
LVNKFVPGLYAVTPPLAGMSGIGRLRFLTYDACGTLLWSITYAGVGYLGRDQLAWIAKRLDQTGYLAALLMLLMLIIYLLVKFERRRRFVRALQGARITPEELKARLDEREPLEILDLRHGFDLRLEPVQIPGARQIPMEEIELRHHEIPRDREIILYCNCPNEASSASAALQLRNYGIAHVRPLHGGIAEWRARGFPVDRCSDIEPLTEPTEFWEDDVEHPIPLHELILRNHHGDRVALAELWCERTVVLVLMRHFGCIFCREQILELRDRLHSIRAEGAELVAVGSGSPEAAAAFRKQFELDFPVLVDPQLRAYRASGLRRDKLAVLNPRMIFDAWRAWSRGARQGRTAGDLWQLGGTFIICPGGEVGWTHANRRAGDHPSAEQVLSVLRVMRS